MDPGADAFAGVDLFAALPCGVVIQDVRGHIVAANPAACRILGLTEDEIRGRTSHDPRWRGVRPDGADMEGDDHPAMVVLKTGLPVGPTIMGVHDPRTGGRRWIEIRSIPLPGEGAGSAVRGVCTTFADVSDRLEAEQALQSREREFRSLLDLLEGVLDGIADVIGIQDRSHRVIRYNAAGYRFLGMTPEQVRGRRCYELIGHDRPCEVCATALCYVSRLPERIEKFVPEMGVWLDVRAYPVLNERGEIRFVVEHLRDVTEERRIQEELAQSRKLDALGQLAGGIAHDFNNMLGGILGAVDLLRRAGEDENARRKWIDLVADSSRRAADLTRQLLAFAHKGEASNTPFDVHETVRCAVGLLERTLDKRVQILTDFAAESGTIAGDPTAMETVFLNLGINAAQAMPSGGELRLATRECAPDSGPGAASADDGRGGRFIEIEVRDTGCGISPDQLPRIFDPFFTTKELGKGTGLGLAAVYGIVRQHRGSLSVASEVGRGTTFLLRLPLVSDAPRPAPAPGTPRPGTGRILVIEDEEALRSTAAAMLEALGYEVVSASNGREGLDVFEREQDAIDLVLLDMIMPVMNGQECFERLVAARPDVKVILTSGYADDSGFQRLRDRGAVGFLAKPYTMSELAEAAHGALAADR